MFINSIKISKVLGLITFKFDILAVEVTVKFEILLPIMVVYLIFFILKLFIFKSDCIILSSLFFLINSFVFILSSTYFFGTSVASS